MDSTASSLHDLEIGEARPKPRLWPKLLALFVALPLIGFLVLGMLPVKADFLASEGNTGAGDAGAGLNRNFPAMVLRANNPLPTDKNDERVQLGRMLFFDPLLSGGNDISCATCHHPDLGFGDGRGLSMGKDGKGLGAERTGGHVIRRAAPSLWNAAYNHKQFWDGRAEDLEAQAQQPIINPDEMAEDPEKLIQELKQIPEYVQLFDKTFKGANGSAITFDNVAFAIAAFERTLTANNTPFDKYVKGDRNALTPAQIRGFNLFRSGRTRCFECHGMPTFNNRDFKIIGVPEIAGQQPDYGRFDVTKGEGNKYAFKVPTLRNVVLNAPYMHNGRFKTLEEVLDFYAAGGGPGMGFKEPVVDDKIHSYTLSKSEKEDLIAFLYALTDEAKVPEFPAKVPSGLPVVPHLKNAARDLVAKFNTGMPKEVLASRAPQTVRVKAGESIQAALDKAVPGDVIEVEPGIYKEELKNDIANITLRGISFTQEQKVAFANGMTSRPVLDGEGKLSDAMLSTGDNFLMENFDVKNYIANGVMTQHANNVTFRNLYVEKTGLYGTYPVSCTGVTIENVKATGIADAALYVGQSRDIVVRNCEVYGNVTGIEVENSINAVVENNYAYDNSGGILVFVLPNNVSKVGRDCLVRNNRVIENNHLNFGNPNSIVSQVPPGTGILVMAADNTEVTANEIRGNDCYGVGVFSLETTFPKGTAFDVGATPDNTYIHGNSYSNNGKNPAGALVRAGLKGADLVWDLHGWSNRWAESSATSATPVLKAGWPVLARKAYWRVLSWLA
ncbi:MAG: right-handed parallel beta-helix repeat-containing protein [Acidobacteria bacterium]|nr:right-handed parallel beta-helix repeat-containing protein [Acidobacteriota bacterium]